MTKKTLSEFMENGNYLPEFLRDFHDQKDLFKRINEIVENAKAREEKVDQIIRNYPDWISAHIYVIDFFLWYMAKCGYTLQKNRSKLDFIDYQADINAHRKRTLEQIGKEMTDRLLKKNT